MNKQDMMKIQTCVLRVNIHCDGCKHKVKKQLQKVEGVYKVNIDVEQGKVTVSGNVDPETLIKKLEKSGKHAELWGPQKGGQISMMNNQFFKDFKIGNNNGGKEGKIQKGAKEQQNGFKNQGKNGIQAPPHQQQMPQKKGLKEEKFFGKDQKSVKFDLPHEEEDDVYSDEFDSEYEDELDDEFDEDFAAHPPPKKGPGSQAKKEAPNGHVKGKNGANKGGKPKKVGGIDAFLKGILGKAGGKNGNVGKSSKKGENHKEDGGKNSKKNSKKGAINDKGAAHNGKANDGWSKKGGENFDGGPKLKNKKQVFDEINMDYGGGGGGGGGGKNMNPMGQMGNFPSAQGLPAAAAAMNVGHPQGVGQGNPYNQQYMQHMMMMNQQRQNGYDSYHPSAAYMRPQPQPQMGYGPAPMGYGPAPMAYGPAPPGYGPAPPSDPFTHIFSDENTDSCSIM